MLVNEIHRFFEFSLLQREYIFENTHFSKDGTAFDVEVHARVVESGGRKLILSVERDITERLKREQEIKKLSAAVEYSPSVVIITDKNNIIEYVNRKFIEISGYNADEVIGQSAGSIGLQPAIEEEKMLRTLAEGKEWHGEFINRKRNGELYYESASISAIRDESSNIAHLIKVAIDITEKKQTESELQRSEQQLRELTSHMRQIREEERKSIARNIHDNLGQALTALKMDLSWLSNRLSEEQLPLLHKTNEMSQLIDQSIQTVKELSSELRPEILDILGLAAAIEWHATEFQKRTGIKCKLNLGENDIKLDKDYAIDCFRIFQEALTNISLHANATRVRINLKQEADKLIMQISDNGRGITGGQLRSSRSFGLIGMRERATAIGGYLEMRGAYEKGTTVKLTVPTV